MIVGIGIDAVNIQRTKRLCDSFISKYFSAEEVEEYRKLSNAHEDVKAQFLASRYAVKEAYAKAFGTGFCKCVVPCEITTRNDKDGRPFIKLSGETLKNAKKAEIHLSITHEEPLAIAIVILEEN